MDLRWAYIRVKKALGEGPPWLFDDATIIHDLNLSLQTMCSKAQLLRDTYAFETRINPTVAGGGTYYQEYAMPQNCESVLSGKAQIGTLWPLDFSVPQAKLQTGGFVASAPVMAYIRKGITLTQMVPGSLETVARIPGNNAKYAPWIIGLYPVPASEYQVFIDYIAVHPWLKNPQDQALIPRDARYYKTWVAYAIANGLEAESNAELRAQYMAEWEKGVDDFAKDMFALQAQVTPPQYGGGYGMGNEGGLTVGVMQPTAANISIE